MRIAFYAPLKPPDHPVPSGDREIARLFLAALRRAGHEPFVASRIRSFDGAGDAEHQMRIAALSRRTTERLLRRWREQPETAPELWFTYHLYYKAPDWLGPPVSAALGIPDVVAEASYAAKRATGPWADGHRAVERALRRADAVIGLNSADCGGGVPLLVGPGRGAGGGRAPRGRARVAPPRCRHRAQLGRSRRRAAVAARSRPLGCAAAVSGYGGLPS